MMNNMQWLLVIFVAHFIVIQSDLFDVVDINANNLIERSEFAIHVSNLQHALEPFIDVAHMNPPVAGSFSLHNFFAQLMSSGVNFVSGFINSLVVILITEIGDKTFFIAAVLAMRNARLVVYLGCMTALAAMHVLSSLMGFALPALLPRAYTHFASIILFIYFGIKLLKDASDMKSEGPSDELHEVEEELINKKGEGSSSADDEDPSELEKGRNSKAAAQHTENLKVFTQAMTLTFVAEWGDRSQIATIALAASKNIMGVILGGLLGHAFCTGVAVIGGRLLAARISERAVAVLGGFLFLAFAIHSYTTGEDV